VLRLVFVGQVDLNPFVCGCVWSCLLGQVDILAVPLHEVLRVVPSGLFTQVWRIHASGIGKPEGSLLDPDVWS